MNTRKALLTAALVMLATWGFSQPVTDIEGNNYNRVTIGNQVWLAENLMTTKFSDGTPIEYANSSLKMQNFTPSYCWFSDREEAIRNRYGALYNWYSIDTKKICPAGWHVPSDAEWNTLAGWLEKNGTASAGGTNYIAKALAAKAGWKASAETGTPGNDQSKSNNKSGFSAVPAGVRYYNDKADSTGIFGFWWSSTEFYTTNAWSRGLMNNKNYVFRLCYGKRTYMSVRCISD